ncbi:FAD-dependent monooxygenase [Leifsonia sp. ZF2019]|uniref:FAD-dependent oxidoreductase n=1 Tax=Leifsonia sp. ZF2019 TaxID=2781978 RepID=UPI001CC1379D|nr:FAD-dependent oxidoreductase [Leifsonia sp. ZF2019]UAJ81654.1 FAD-dependent monooxygenase [Leifsonia sp. ZF2019]
MVVVGGGIAGSAAAALLARDGHTVTLLERAGELRTSGSPVDIRGDAIGVVARLGLEAELRSADTGVTRLRIVDTDGRRTAETRLRRADSPEIELSRMVLGRALARAAADVADVRMGASPERIEQDGDRSVVLLRDGGTVEADLVVGADGQHSAVRRLVWGGEHGFTHPIGLTIATVAIGRGPWADDPTVLEMHNRPGLSLSVHPAGGAGVAAFIFRTPGDADGGRRDRGDNETLLRERYSTMGWRAPELLDRLASAPDLYIDTVARVRTPSWSHGRVVLLGDAASSVTILGEGSSMALVGAATLTDALHDAGSFASALSAFERAHRPIVEAKQRGVRLGASFLVPASHLSLGLRNLAVRVSR